MTNVTVDNTSLLAEEPQLGAASGKTGSVPAFSKFALDIK